MWIIILIIAIIILTVVLKNNTKKPNSSTRVRRLYNSTTYNSRLIDNCVSNEDVQYQISYETKRVIECVEKSRSAIKEAVLEANKQISTEWLVSYKKIIKISTNLDENLRYHSQRNLDRAKFQYYTNLHFRLMIAADITYNEYCRIYKSFEAINQLILTVDSGEKKIQMSREQLISVKDSLKMLKNAFLNRVHELNSKTGTIRDKIGNECGERGKAWWEERKNTIVD